MLAAVLLMLAGAWLGLLLLALVCLLLSKVLKDEWSREFFSDYFYAYRAILTFGIWK